MARVDAQELLVALALDCDRNAGDLVGRAVRKVDIHQHVARHPRIEDALDQIGREFDPGVPARRTFGAESVSLRERKGRNTEHGALHRAGNGAGIGHVFRAIAAAIATYTQITIYNINWSMYIYFDYNIPNYNR